MRMRKSIHSAAVAPQAGPSRPIVFTLGLGIGALSGVVIGTLVGKQVVHLLGMLGSLIDRRLSNGDDERIKFELLLQ